FYRLPPLSRGIGDCQHIPITVSLYPRTHRKFVRIAVDWLLRSDIGEVIKNIVDDEAFPDYAMPKKTAGGERSRGEKSARNKHSAPRSFTAAALIRSTSPARCD